ncbi:hypothetical protein HDV01_006502 [Terramyces sp. JEL0728]|nr:hypothetical protein HDV01_006502 [Terramyces sp. JEL0728]
MLAEQGSEPNILDPEKEENTEEAAEENKHADELSKENSQEQILDSVEQHEQQYIDQDEERREKIKQKLLDKSLVPKSYYSNSAREILILQYVENFDRQYTQIYPGRKTLALHRENEFGIRPRVLPSPTYTVGIQSGNSFDMATLLVSLLTGVGYDAYVVSGYATKAVTLLDQSKANAKELYELVPEAFRAKKQDETAEEVKNNQKYRVKPPKQLKSAFIMKQEAKLKQLRMQEEQRLRDLALLEPEVEEEDSLRGLRVHAWVLVLPGKREVSEAFFIEPTTGKIYDCEHDQYLGVESVWSATNYWVNMQICYDGLKGISFDLGDNVKWEFVLLDNTVPGVKQNKDGDDAGSDEEEEETKINEVIDLPRSWVSPISITLEQFEAKCTNGGKTIYYKNAKKEIFANFHRPDGMVNRITFYEKDKLYPNMTIEVFANRRDKLLNRVRLNEIVHEFFHAGRTHGLKEHIKIDGKTKEMKFYGSARPDGLVNRTEDNRKVVFLFEDRDDFLWCKSITYETVEVDGLMARGPMVKMTEKFLPNSENTLKDIAKKTYFWKDERIRINFHLDAGRIVASLREFRKPAADQKGQVLDIMQDFEVDPYVKPMKKQHLYSQLTDLLRTEQLFLQSIKVYERELSDILQLRTLEEQDVSLVVSIYDTLRNETKLPVDEQGAEIHKGDEENQKSVEIDYLSPFLINFETPDNLSRDDMVSVKDACLKSLRERLVEKANIIQRRLDEVTAEYQKRQLAYSRNADSMTVEDTEAYVKFCNEALFKIHILEKRLAKGLEFTVQISDFPENLSKTLLPQDYVLQTATAKTRSVYDKNTDALVIGADTVVVLNNQILEKPSSKEHAFEMLKSLSGKSHFVLTAVCLIKDDKVHSFVEKTAVNFGDLSDQEILDYVETGEPMDKAGGYGYQGLGCTLVKSIEGCYYNVVGLPVYRLVQTLKSIGVAVGK